MTRRLPQSKERLERSEHVPSVIEELLNLREGRCPDGVVDLALALIELDQGHLFRARRQLRRDLELSPPQDEGPDALAELRRGERIARLDRGRVALQEIGPATE